MKITVRNELVERAKTRKDGVYKYKGYYWVCKNHGLVAYGDQGDIYSCYGSFTIRHSSVNSWEQKKVLKDSFLTK